MTVPKVDWDAQRASPHEPNAGLAYYSPNGTYGPRIQQDYQLVLVYVGSAHVTVDGSPRVIPAGHVGLLLPQRKKFFQFYHEQATRHSWVALPTERTPDELRQHLDAAPPCLPLSQAVEQCVLAARAVVSLDDEPGRPLLTTIASASLMVYLTEARSVAANIHPVHPTVAAAREIIRQGACAGMTVTEVARQVATSPEHLIRLFRREMKQTPGAMMHDIRIAHALQLLTHTGLSVAEVARQSGFADAKHFARSIQAKIGMTPTQLRKRGRSGVSGF